MNLLHCTQKLLQDIGLSPQEFKEPSSSSNCILGNWYANSLLVSKRKAILFTNEKTLFSFFVPGLTKTSSLKIQPSFLAGLSYNLLDEGIEKFIVEKLLFEYRELGIAKTEDRHILGSMNDIAKMFKYYIAYEVGGWEHCDLWAIAHKVNQAPMKFLQYRCASDSIHKLLDSVKW